MRLNKQPDNQLNLIDEFEAASREPVPEKIKEEKDSVAERALEEIDKKIEIATQKVKKRDNKTTMVSIKGIREELEKEKNSFEAPEVNTKVVASEKITEDDTEAFSPAEEYYGRWNSFRKTKKR